MRRRVGLRKVLLGLCAASGLLLANCASAPQLNAAPGTVGAAEVVAIWNGQAPGRSPPPAPESQTRQSQGWRDITVIKNVAAPSLTVVRPPAGRANGSAMIILPGGAFTALAWDLEGTEVAQFLAQRGITAFVLKYRVRDGTPEMMEKFRASPTFETLLELQAPTRAEATEDGMQAVRYLRQHSSEYGIDPAKVGMMGFSAGAMTTMSVLHAADDASRPNLAAPIYGAMIEKGAPPKAPPIFVAVASDDKTTRPNMTMDIFAAWQAAGAAAEVHIFETGDHGFGLGRPGTSTTEWPALFEVWLTKHGFIAPR